MGSRRYRGYVEALEAAGLKVDPALVSLSGMGMETGRSAIHELHKAGVEFDGVVAITDTVAIGVIRGLADLGLRCPEDVRVVGFDDIAASEFLAPSLSTSPQATAGWPRRRWSSSLPASRTRPGAPKSTPRPSSSRSASPPADRPPHVGTSRMNTLRRNEIESFTGFLEAVAGRDDRSGVPAAAAMTAAYRAVPTSAPRAALAPNARAAPNRSAVQCNRPARP